MAGRDPELTPELELHNALQQVQIYDALDTAANDARTVLDIMLSASGPGDARRALESRYGFTETQALAVMDVQFRRLTSADRRKIEQQRGELAARVRALEEELGPA